MPDTPTEGRDGIFATAAYHCPYCGCLHDAAMAANDGGCPRPGDVTICLQCAGVLLFDPSMIARKPTDTELCRLMLSRDWPEVVRARRTVAAAIHGRHG